MDKFDLNKLAEGGTYNLELKGEDPEERAARLRREEADARLARRKDLGLFLAGILFGLGIAATSLWVILDRSYSAESRTQAWSVISIIIGGVIGYLYGRSSRADP